MEYHYYEIIACKITGITPDDLFTKCRKKEIVLARYFCINYRIEFLNKTYAVGAKRYGLDHASVNHLNETLDNYKSTKHENYALYLRFLDSCVKVADDYPKLSDEQRSTIDEEVKRIGFKKYLRSCRRSFKTLFRLIKHEESELEIKEAIKLCHLRIIELEYLYE